MKIPTVANPTYTPMTVYLIKVHPLKRVSSCLLGGFVIISKSGGLNPRAVAGGPSVTKLTQRS